MNPEIERLEQLATMAMTHRIHELYTETQAIVLALRKFIEAERTTSEELDGWWTGINYAIQITDKISKENLPNLQRLQERFSTLYALKARMPSSGPTGTVDILPPPSDPRRDPFV